MKSEDWAKLVVETRELSGDSQEDFAKRLGITQQTVSLWEKGQLPRKKAMNQMISLNSFYAKNETPPATTIDASSQEESERKTTVPEALEMTETVLNSKTVYQRALMSSIQAFHRAVKGEEEMKSMHERMDQLERTVAEKMDEMMRLMTGGFSKKRDFKIA